MSKKISVLIIDDDEDLLELIEEFMDERGGFSITKSDNAIEALRFLSAHQYDYVLLDIFLPGLRGLDVLKNFANKSTTKFIAMTGTHDLEPDCMDLGAYHFLKKPIEFGDFFDLFDPEAFEKLKLRLKEEEDKAS